MASVVRDVEKLAKWGASFVLTRLSAPNGDDFAQGEELALCTRHVFLSSPIQRN